MLRSVLPMARSTYQKVQALVFTHLAREVHCPVGIETVCTILLLKTLYFVMTDAGFQVLSTLIRIPGWGNVILDCGEGTWGQLARHFGTDESAPDNAWDILRDVKCIFASHIHGDHHMGLSQLLAKRKLVCLFFYDTALV